MDNNLSELMEVIERRRHRSGQQPGPSTHHLSFIPQRLRSKALFMYSEEPKMQMMPTVFIGTIRPNYTEEMWKIDVDKWKTHFETGKVTQIYGEMKLLPLPENSSILDSADAILKIHSVLPTINALPVREGIRVICLGTGYSSFLYDAISYLFKEWKEPDGITKRGYKHMEFITSGDTENRDLSDFCQWLCISDTCQSVAFYNTMMYHPFGYASAQYQARN